MRDEHLLHRDAVTVIEIVVAMAIVTVLAALLIPAILHGREAARRVQCSSNVRQVAIAIHSHDAVHGHLPTGGWGWRWHGEPERGFGSRQPGGWIYNILPYCEQGQVRQMGEGLTGVARSQALSESAAVPIAIFVCPSRRGPGGQPFVHPFEYHNLGRPERVARSDYAACSGDRAPDVSLRRGRGPQSLAEGDFPGYVWSDIDLTGIVFRRSKVTCAGIVDGLSNTYLVGEKYLNRSHYVSGTAQNDDQHMLVGFDSDTLRTTDLDYPPFQDSKSITSDHSFGSAHDAVFHMAMADGSVNAVSFRVAVEVHRSRGNRDDGVVGTLP